MDKFHITFYQDKYLTQAQDLLKNNPNIFTYKDISIFHTMLSEYMKVKPHHSNEIITLVAILNNSLIGLLMYENMDESSDYYELHWLVVSPSEQHKGYGVMLMTHAIDLIKQAGGKYIMVKTSNEKHNEKVKKFYTKLHFKKVAIIPDYFPPPMRGFKKREDCIFYLKKLT